MRSREVSTSSTTARCIEFRKDLAAAWLSASRTVIIGAAAPCPRASSRCWRVRRPAFWAW